MSKKPIEPTPVIAESSSPHRSLSQTDSLPSTPSSLNGPLSMTEIKTSGKARILTVGQKLPPVTMQKVEAGEGVDMIGMGADAHPSAQAALAAGLGDRLSQTKRMPAGSSQEGDSLSTTHVLPKPAGGPSRVEVSMSHLVVSGSASLTVVFLPGEPEPVPAVWNIPFLEDRYFVGRKSIEAQLVRSFPPLAERKEKMGAAQSVVLTAHGLGGVGKTFVALHFAWHTTQVYTFRAWFSAETKERLIRDYRDFCRAYHIRLSEKPSDEEVSGAVKGWLGSHSGWLLVYDNAPDYEAVRAYLPTSGGDILLTSRSTKVWPGEQIRVDILSEGEAIELVKRRIRPGNFAAKLSEAEELALQSLAKELGYLPLALAQAAAYIMECKTSVADYLALYRDCTDELLDEHKLRSDEYPEPVAKTWLITMRRIRKELPLAAEVFNGCAYLASDAIPQAVGTHLVKSLMMAEEKELKEPAEAKVLLMTHKVLSCIAGYSMANIALEQKTISIHRLVQQVTRSQQQEPDKQRTLLQQVLKSVNDSCPDDDQVGDLFLRRQAWIPHLEAIVSYIGGKQESLTPLFASAIDLLGVIYLEDWADAVRAEVQFEQGLKIAKAIYDPKDGEIARALNHLGTAHCGVGNHLKACEDYQRALEIAKYNKDYRFVGLLLTNLCDVYRLLGNYQEALEIGEQALVCKETHFGSGSDAVATTQHNLGCVYLEIRNYRRASMLYEQALSIKQKYYPAEHFEMAIALGAVGNAYLGLGKYSEAREPLEQAISIIGKHLGTRHIKIVGPSCSLGSMHRLLKNYPKAQELLETVLDIQSEFYKVEHVDMCTSLCALSQVYYDIENYTKAQELLNKALRIQEKHYRVDHVTMVSTLCSLNEVYIALRDYSKAYHVLERAVQIKEKHVVHDLSWLVSLFFKLIDICMNLKDNSKAYYWGERLLSFVKKHYNPLVGILEKLNNREEHTRVAATITKLGDIYFGLQHFKLTIALHTQALFILENYSHVEPLTMALILGKLGCAYLEIMELQNACVTLEKSLSIYEKHSSFDEGAFVRVLHNLGNAHMKLENYSKAYELFERVSQVLEKHQSLDSELQFIETLISFGGVCCQLQNYEKARALLEQALQLVKKHYGDAHIKTAKVLNNLGAVYGRLKKFAKAHELWTQALTIAREQSHPDLPLIQMVTQNLSAIQGLISQETLPHDVVHPDTKQSEVKALNPVLRASEQCNTDEKKYAVVHGRAVILGPVGEESLFFVSLSQSTVDYLRLLIITIGSQNTITETETQSEVFHLPWKWLRQLDPLALSELARGLDMEPYELLERTLPILKEYYDAKQSLVTPSIRKRRAAKTPIKQKSSVSAPPASGVILGHENNQPLSRFPLTQSAVDYLRLLIIIIGSHGVLNEMQLGLFQLPGQWLQQLHPVAFDKLAQGLGMTRQILNRYRFISSLVNTGSAVAPLPVPGVLISTGVSQEGSSTSQSSASSAMLKPFGS